MNHSIQLLSVLLFVLGANAQNSCYVVGLYFEFFRPKTKIPLEKKNNELTNLQKVFAFDRNRDELCSNNNLKKSF